MCTAITLKTSENHHLVGRNFDIHPMNDLSVALVPREFEYVNRVTNEEMKTKYDEYMDSMQEVQQDVTVQFVPLLDGVFA